MTKPICPFCREEWSEENVLLEDVLASEGCGTCGYGAEVTGSVVIRCHKCKKVMYRKDFKERPNG